MRHDCIGFPRAGLLAVLTALWSAAPSAFAALPMQPGLWELRVTTTVSRKAQPAEGSRECLSQADIDHETRALPKPDATCAVSNITKSGKVMSYDLACTRDEVSHKGRMEIVFSGDSYDGIADFKVNAPGKTETPMTVMVNARRVGECTK